MIPTLVSGNDEGYAQLPSESQDGSESPLIRRSLKSHWIILSSFFVSFVSLVYINYLIGARRICHDTWLFSYTWRAYLSDSLRQNVFPFWDPFSSPGVPTSDFASGVYYPIAIVLGKLTAYSPNLLVVEIILTGVLAMLGSYLWLRHQRISQPLALVGATAYVSSGPVVTAVSGYNVQITMCFIPYLFYSVELITSHRHRGHYILGTFILVCSVWLIMTGGYLGLNYACFLFIGLWGLLKLSLNPKNIPRSLICFTAAIALVLALLFLQISEYLTTFLPQLEELRGIGESYDTFHGSLSPFFPLSLFFPNSAYLPHLFGGFGQMYMGAALVAAIPAGFVAVRHEKMDMYFLGFALLIAFAAMGQGSPVAILFTHYVPGFAWFRWHLYLGSLVIFLLITLSLRLLDRFLLESLASPSSRKRYALTAGIFFAIMAAFSIAFEKENLSAHPLKVSSYELLEPLVLLGVELMIYCLMWCLLSSKITSGSKMLSCPLYGLTICISFGIAIAILFSRLNPSFLLSYADNLIGNSQPVHDSVKTHGIPGFLAALNMRWTTLLSSEMLVMDLIQSGVVIGVLILLIFSFSDSRWKLSWLIFLLIFCDMTVASQRYQQGNTYWTTSQIPISSIERPASIEYDGNNRDPALSHVSVTDWKTIQGYENRAIQLRQPTFLSYGPISDQRTIAVMKSHGGVSVFSKLLWLLPELPEAPEVTLENWQEFATEPDIRKLKLTPNGLEVEVSASHPGVLVWTDSWGVGWHAAVNNHIAVVRKILGVMKGVEISAGYSKVRFFYHPKHYITSLTLFFLALAALIGILFSLLFSEKEYF